MALAQQFKLLAFTGSELDSILNDIDRLFGAGFHYAAMHVALSIPDICSSLETTSDERLRYKIYERYVAWCTRYFQPKFFMFTAEDCWALRCGVVHNGKLFGHKKARYDRVIFQPPGQGITHEMSTHPRGAHESALTLNLERFLHLMVTSAQEWFAEKKDDKVVRENMAGLVRTRPEGLAPHIVGMPVIA